MKKTYSILVLISIVTIVGCVYVVSEAQKKTVDSTNNSQLKSYAYLFQHKENPYIGNTVGYFAHGAFLWYVPDWLPDNWHEVSRAEQEVLGGMLKAGETLTTGMVCSEPLRIDYKMYHQEG